MDIKPVLNITGKVDRWEPQFSWSEDMEEIAWMIAQWYKQPGCETGGPLHIVTDDQNVEDDDLIFCHEQLLVSDVGSKHLALEILVGLATMSIAERFTVCNEWRHSTGFNGFV